MRAAPAILASAITIGLGASQTLANGPVALPSLPAAYPSYIYMRCAAYFSATLDWSDGMLYSARQYDQLIFLQPELTYMARLAWSIGAGWDRLAHGRYGDDGTLRDAYDDLEAFYSARLQENFVNLGNPLDASLLSDGAYCINLADLPK